MSETSPRAMAPQDLTRIRTASDPQIAPDGHALVFTSARHADWDYDNAVDLWRVAADGGEPRRLTDTAGPLSTPAFSPDGTQLAYLGNRYLNQSGRNTQVFTLPAAGGKPRCLTADSATQMAPASANLPIST